MSTVKKIQYKDKSECAIEYAYKDGEGRILYNVIPTTIEFDSSLRKLKLSSPVSVLSEASIPDYTLPQASGSVLGGIKTGFTQVDKNYPVKLDSSGNAYVNVPWSSGSYTLPTATDSVLGGVKIGEGIKISNGVISIDADYIKFAMLNKGDLITMDLGNTTVAYGTLHQYRVLKKMGGTKVLVVAMYEPTTSQVFGSSQAYSGSSLDTYLNSTFYGTLNSTAKSAIVSQSITQYKYTYNSSVLTDNHRSYADYSTKAVYASGLSRNIFALDVEDIEEYFGGTGGSASAKTAGSFAISALMNLFYKQSATISGKYFWLRSARTDNSSNVWDVYGNYDSVDYNSYSSSGAVRPAFVIDLSKVSWSTSN